MKPGRPKKAEKKDYRIVMYVNRKSWEWLWRAKERYDPDGKLSISGFMSHCIDSVLRGHSLLFELTAPDRLWEQAMAAVRKSKNATILVISLAGRLI